jgi:hypothetical protein
MAKVKTTRDGEWLMLVITDAVMSMDDKIAQIEVLTRGRDLPSAFLRVYDPDGYEGRGYIALTQHVEQALRFPSFEAVLDCWKMQSTTVPLRDDGKPNRPLTAYSASPVRRSEYER